MWLQHILGPSPPDRVVTQTHDLGQEPRRPVSRHLPRRLLAYCFRDDRFLDLGRDRARAAGPRPVLVDARNPLRRVASDLQQHGGSRGARRCNNRPAALPIGCSENDPGPIDQAVRVRSHDSRTCRSPRHSRIPRVLFGMNNNIHHTRLGVKLSSRQYTGTNLHSLPPPSEDDRVGSPRRRDHLERCQSRNRPRQLAVVAQKGSRLKLDALRLG